MNQTFTHPGVFVSADQLAFMREKVAAYEDPWYVAYQQITASEYASLTRPSSPESVVDCGSGDGGNPVCSRERKDALAAYTQALCWSLTGDVAHAQKAIDIMDDWSAVLTAHTGSNAPLQAGWAGSSWARAAELVRHTFSGPWPRMERFAELLRSVYLPMVLHNRPEYTKTYNGNWELMMMEAGIFISVFLDDPDSYDMALEIFRQRVLAYIYLEKDGPTPNPPVPSWAGNQAKIMSYWHNPVQLVNGVSQETCRDFEHTGYGIDSISHVAETTRIQGNDLYQDPDFKDRLRHALGLHTRYANGVGSVEEISGPRDPEVSVYLGPVTEPGYNALHHRLGVPMDQTGDYTERHRPQGTNTLWVAWETLTHAQNPY
ncbi:alginate lyase family protein [Streptomyces sioyaensis]|uniref:alginate lyase family protein n=1 Tax=Streptomyces sioyaensis TaxID=67364 RepID=UPI0037AD9643